MTRQRGFSTKRSRRGFTMVELMVTVAILIVLLAVTILAIIPMRKRLRQQELDSKAETIYMAVQMRMSELRAAGYESLYQYYDNAQTNGVLKLGVIPADADDTSITADTICYVVSTLDEDGNMSSAADDLMAESTIDEELRTNRWHVEFDPQSGSVYGVFYSESEEIPTDTNTLDKLRQKSGRLNYGATVGYYGGELSQIEVTSDLKPGILIENEEQLTATFYCNNPSFGEQLTFEITLIDAAGNKYTRMIDHAELTQTSARNYRYVWTLDSLKNSSSRFYEQTEHKLECGTKLSVSLTVKSTDNLVDAATATAETNGLFADDSTDNTAYISYARHLQNLDDASGVSQKIQYAVQKSDISFKDDANNDKDWYTLYNDKKFTPIDNKNLISYDGSSTTDDSQVKTAIYSLHVASSSGNAGLFEKFAGTIKNVTLTGTKIDGGNNVGALVGLASGNLTIDNCRVYLSATQGDLEDIKVVDEASKVTQWLSGKTIGGLVGASNSRVDIKDSFSSTVLKGETLAGGLIGQVNGTVSANGVYADSYISAPTTGGLFGATGNNASISLTNFYSAGYQNAEIAAAGIVAGKVASAQNGYSACYYTSESAKVYSTAQSIVSASNVFYISGANHASGTIYKSYQELSQKDTATTLGTAFTSSSGGATYPYNLMAQGLSTYSYPRLSALDHYGDWQAEFESGLVYYELYSDGTYGFEGSNVSTLASDKVVVGDGYALAYNSEPAADYKATATVGDKSVDFSAGASINVTKNSETYYLVPLPKEINNIDLSSSANFYQKITIKDTNGENSYYFNPYFAKTVTINDTTPKAPSTIYIRSARQLYGMSLYYSNFATETAKSVYYQELDIDYTSYAWTDYYTSDSAIESQAPIDAENGFVASYNGDYHTVSGLTIKSKSAATGFFGTVANGATVRNLFLTGRAGTEYIEHLSSDGSAAIVGSRNSSQIGALAGVNNGTIRNCAVSGYTIKYYGYNSNTALIGGFVGENNGTIRGCSADSPNINVAENSSYAYVGGFVGRNSGSVVSSYSTGYIRALESRSSTVLLAGFAGDNTSGTTLRCYSATAITASGTAESYGFARMGGAVVSCYYLDGGTYSYREKLYPYNTSGNEFAAEAAGEPITGSNLQRLTMSDFSSAVHSYCHDKTEGENYIYPAVVRSGSSIVHYGDWPIQQSIGTLGLFYWEYEDFGSNNGYHISYIGTADGVEIKDNTLCTEHDDGGVITSYGYGYFYGVDDAAPTLTTESTNLGNENTDAESALQAQMSSYKFVAYTTGEGSGNLHTTTYTQNCTWTLSSTIDGQSSTFTYSVSPFFADAISLDSTKLGNNAQTNTNNAKPGFAGNEYQIRSEAQLQFINWNAAKQTTSFSIVEGTHNQQGTENYYNYYGYLSERTVYLRNSYPYLLSGAGNTIPTKNLDLYWKQSHDLDAYAENGSTKTSYFTPIGSFYDQGGNDANANAYIAFFPYSYDGQSYTIKNIEIHTPNQAIGLFGVTAGAQLQNIVMYSDQGNTIEVTSDGSNWYTMGGLVGLAGSRESTVNFNTKSVFTNCSVSGYTIIDKRSASPGWGGGCVGGLVGMTNMDITDCSAVNDIELRIGNYSSESYKNLRVGGIAGVARSIINSCYAGGSIKSYVAENDTGSYNSACIWVGGIAGGIVVRNTGNLNELVGFCDRSLVVANCYSYVDMPEGPKGSTNGYYNATTGYNHVRASESIASNGEMLRSNMNGSYSRASGWFARNDVSQRTVRIYNCYALKDKVSGTSDYQNFSGYTSFNGTDINTFHKDNTCRVLVYNDSTMYLTYDEMQNALTKLNKGDITVSYEYESGNSDTTATTAVAGDFNTVTTTEQGAPINGKYSFPGSDTELKGLNYPFPTVLTQKDIFGDTVNVHYGAWPKSGIYWEQSSLSLDLITNRDAMSGEATLDVELRLYGTVSGTLTADSITFVDDEGTELTDSPIEVVSVSAKQTDTAGSYYTVKLKGIKTGTAFVRATLDGKTVDTRVDVTSSITLKAEPNTLTLASGGETQTVTLKLYTADVDGNEQQIKPAANKVTFTVTTKSGADYIIPDESVSYSAATGVATFGVKAALLDSISAQESHITITVTYAFGDGENDKATATADIVTEIQSPNFAVFKLGDESTGVRFAGTTQQSINSLASELTEGNGLYLRGSEGDFSTVSLDIFTLTVDGTSYKADAEGKFRRLNAEMNENECIATITLGAAQVNKTNNYTFYSVELSGYELENNATLSVAVRNGADMKVIIPGAEPAEPQNPDKGEGTEGNP